MSCSNHYTIADDDDDDDSSKSEECIQYTKVCVCVYLFMSVFVHLKTPECVSDEYFRKC